MSTVTEHERDGSVQIFFNDDTVLMFKLADIKSHRHDSQFYIIVYEDYCVMYPIHIIKFVRVKFNSYSGLSILEKGLYGDGHFTTGI